MTRECDLKTIYKDVVDESGAWRGDPSDGYCINLIVATTAAINARDWQRTLEVAMEREHNCAQKMTGNELADSINDQANAYIQLGNMQKAVSAANRCLHIANIPDCHIYKGYALLMLSRRREGADEAKLGKILADQEVSRLSAELERASSVSETERLKSELDKYKSLARLAQAILTKKPPRP